MKVPQIIIIALEAMACGLSLAKHGETRNTKYNFWLQLFSSALTMVILWWGGFFKC